MADVYLIPLTSGLADQYVTVELSGNPYRLRVLWNERGGYYSLSIYTVAGVAIVLGQKMVKNYPLMETHANDLLPDGELYYVLDAKRRPTFDDLATAGNLYYVADGTPEAILPSTVMIEADEQLGTTWDSSLTTWDGGDTTWDM